jgi:hypothetical protein
MVLTLLPGAGALATFRLLEIGRLSEKRGW